MKIEKQVCSLEQAKKLKELLGEVYGLFVYMENKALASDSKIMLSTQTESFKQMGKIEGNGCIKYFPAFTVAELGVLLPKSVSQNKEDEIYFEEARAYDNGFIVDYTKYSEDCGESIIRTHKSTEAEARAAMLIYLLENNIITADEVNKRLNEN